VEIRGDIGKLPLLPACPGLGLLARPSRLPGLAAVDAVTGKADWRAVALPTAAPSPGAAIAGSST